MKTKPLFFLFFLSISISVGTYAQDAGREFIFPDIPGYKTLKCDFHMHTVFSDGDVWPTVRVREAVNEGLDAICITEHLEYYSHSQYISGDHNSSYEIAKPYADKKDLILIRGAEITKGMPPGHFNFLFIEDANTIDSVDWKTAILQANEQGAFVFWNHPGWRMDDEVPVWYAEHSWLYSRGLIQGIEIVNENSYYPLAHQWGLDSNLTLLGNSDIHAPIDLFFDRNKGEHRPITLVFAKERSEEGIREALDSGRTAIYHKEMIIGEEWFLRELFYSSISTYEVHSQNMDGTSSWESYLSNDKSCFTYQLTMAVQEGEEEKSLIFEPDEGILIDFPGDDLNRKWYVTNLFTAPGKCLTIRYIQPY